MKIIFLLLSIISVVLAENIYLRIDQNNYSILYATVLPGNSVSPDSSISGDYRIDVIHNGQVIFSQRFPYEKSQIFYDGISGGGIKEIEEPIRIYIPYISSSETVKLYYKEKLIMEHRFDYLCIRNGFCEKDEDYLSCPVDCGKENIPAYNLDTLNSSAKYETGVVQLMHDKVVEPTPKDILDYIVYTLKKPLEYPQICAALIFIIIALAAGYYMGKNKPS